MGYDDDDEDENVTAQAFAGLKNHVDGYKSYISKLKKGAKSGISQSFGNAAELLPREVLPQVAKPKKPFENGAGIVRKDGDPAQVRRAVEQLVLMADADPDYSTKRTDGRQVIGVMFEGDRKLLMLDDYSVVDASEGPLPEEQEILPPTPNQPVPAQPTFTSISSYAANPASIGQPQPTPVLYQTAVSMPQFAAASQDQSAPLTTPPAAATTLSEQTSPPVVAQTDQDASSDASGDIRVTTPNGQRLWDIFLDGGTVALVQWADGTNIQKTEDDNYVICWALKPGQKVPQVEIVKDVTADPETGNIYYQNLSGKLAVALLNNGWRIDQKKVKGDDDEFYVTEPRRQGQPQPEAVQVVNLVIDPSTGDIIYDTIDGGASMTLRCRKL
ncbi:MAG TPA: hypothetical protein V6C97_11325 [Oculatellaceae cyanobacterium]